MRGEEKVSQSEIQWPTSSFLFSNSETSLVVSSSYSIDEDLISLLVVLMCHWVQLRICINFHYTCCILWCPNMHQFSLHMLYNYNEHVWVVTARGCRDVASPPAHPALSTAWWRSLCSTQERLRLNWSTSSCSMCPHYGWHGAAQNRGSLNSSEAGVVERTSPRPVPAQFPPWEQLAQIARI